MKLQSQEFSCPLTHDLVANLVTELKDQTFFATISVDISGGKVDVDSRRRHRRPLLRRNLRLQ